MAPLIRADLYRLARGKILYVTAGLLAVLSVVTTLTDVTIGNSFITTLVDMDFSGATMTGSAAARSALTTTSNMEYAVAAVFVAVAASLFSSGAIKNSLAAGVPRTRVYVAAWLLCSGVAVILLGLYVAVAIAAATIVRGPGHWTGAYAGAILTGLGAQIVPVLVFTSLGIFWAFLLRHSAAAIAAYLACVLILPMPLPAWHSGGWPILYLPADAMNWFSCVDALPGWVVAVGLAWGLAYIGVFVTAGLVVFRRADIA